MDLLQNLDVHLLIGQEKKECTKSARGRKEQLIIDTAPIEQAVAQKQNISIAYIDFKSGFDSRSHSWLLQVLCF